MCKIKNGIMLHKKIRVACIVHLTRALQVLTFCRLIILTMQDFLAVRSPARMKNVEVFDFLDDLEVVDCLVDSSKLIVMSIAKGIVTNPHSVVQRLLRCEKSQTMKVKKFSVKRAVFVTLRLSN